MQRLARNLFSACEPLAKLYPLSRTLLKLEVPVFGHPQKCFCPVYWTVRFLILVLVNSYLGSAQTSPRREAGKGASPFLQEQSDPCHSVKGCPSALYAAGVLSLDSVPAPDSVAISTAAPSSSGFFSMVGTGGAAIALSG